MCKNKEIYGKIVWLNAISRDRSIPFAAYSLSSFMSSIFIMVTLLDTDCCLTLGSYKSS